ncbi:DUF2523 domain-containing protein [Pseudomonas aeruginosa]|uniref:DUF2523 domain-containing protein n=2 Tax=Pseudomonas aeruginosa TaxID=287 RepID=UPI0021A5ED2C|nr:DUF2523 domain-containing protein [Pseudomonas aeruginosa]
MPLFVALFSFLSSVAGPLVAKVLISLGVGAVTYAGINLLISQVKTYAISQFGAVGADVAAILGLAKFDVAMNIILLRWWPRLLSRAWIRPAAALPRLAVSEKVVNHVCSPHRFAG